MIATFYHIYVILEYIGPSTGHMFVQLIFGVTTSSSYDLLTPLSHWQKIVLYQCLWDASPFLNQGLQLLKVMRNYLHLRKPRLLSPLRSCKERSGLSTLGLRRWTTCCALTRQLSSNHNYTMSLRSGDFEAHGTCSWRMFCCCSKYLGCAAVIFFEISHYLNLWFLLMMRYFYMLWFWIY